MRFWLRGLGKGGMEMVCMVVGLMGRVVGEMVG